MLTTFASRFGGRVELNPEFVVERNTRYYFLNPTVRKIASGNFYYAGLYLGKVRHKVFFPSFNFLNMLVPVAVNKIFLEKKAAWLFICGRDVFREGILKWVGSKRNGDYILVLNEFHECLGFGSVTNRFEEGRVAVRNVFDVGDFLRRES